MIRCFKELYKGKKEELMIMNIYSKKGLMYSKKRHYQLLIGLESKINLLKLMDKDNKNK
jgi:hypothetical protein